LGEQAKEMRIKIDPAKRILRFFFPEIPDSGLRK